ncbi:uncharacterized protein JCM10292_000609 [Rhodotorula paludigena]|uniref:uncharacterized protein n=1 Tax=Rhodotorula paludigena TaxID=86838 RepID=UPI00316B191C
MDAPEPVPTAPSPSPASPDSSRFVSPPTIVATSECTPVPLVPVISRHDGLQGFSPESERITGQMKAEQIVAKNVVDSSSKDDSQTGSSEVKVNDPHFQAHLPSDASTLPSLDSLCDLLATFSTTGQIPSTPPSPTKYVFPDSSGRASFSLVEGDRPVGFAGAQRSAGVLLTKHAEDQKVEAESGTATPLARPDAGVEVEASEMDASSLVLRLSTAEVALSNAQLDAPLLLLPSSFLRTGSCPSCGQPYLSPLSPSYFEPLDQQVVATAQALVAEHWDCLKRLAEEGKVKVELVETDGEM